MTISLSLCNDASPSTRIGLNQCSNPVGRSQCFRFFMSLCELLEKLTKCPSLSNYEACFQIAHKVITSSPTTQKSQ